MPVVVAEQVYTLVNYLIVLWGSRGEHRGMCLYPNPSKSRELSKSKETIWSDLVGPIVVVGLSIVFSKVP